MFTILTYNIRNGGRGWEDALRTIIAAARPDIVILQELFDDALLRQLAGDLQADHFFAQGNRRFHLGLISRFPICSANSYHRLPIRTALLEATIELPSPQRLHLWGAHLMAHFALPCEVWRMLEVSTILKRTRQFSDDLCCIAGDFNTIAPGERVLVHGLPPRLRRWVLAQGGRAFTWALALLKRGCWRDCYRQMHADGPGWTLPSHRPNARLDYMFANPSLAAHLRGCSIVTEPDLVYRASDHLPLKAVFDAVTVFGQ